MGLVLKNWNHVRASFTAGNIWFQHFWHGLSRWFKLWLNICLTSGKHPKWIQSCSRIQKKMDYCLLSLVALRNTALPYFKLFMRHCSLALHNASHRCGPKPCRATLVLRLTLWRGFWELKMLRSNGSKWPGWSRLPPDTQTKALKTRSPIAELLSCWHFNVRGFCSNSFQMLETDSVIPYELYELILNV